MILTVKNFSCYCMCTQYNVKGYYSVCNDFSYNFLSGTYILQGEIDCGAWAFTDSISKKSKKCFVTIDPMSELFVNDCNISLKKLQKQVWCIDDKLSKKASKVLMYDMIAVLSKKYKVDKSVDELLEKFGIPIKETAQFVIRPYSPYYPCYVALIGYLKGYKIFTASWHGQIQFNKEVYEKIIRALQDEDCILIIPSSEKNDFGKNCTYIKMISLFCEEARRKYLGEELE